MEVEWTLGSVIDASPGQQAGSISSSGNSTIFDVFLIFFCILITLLVAVLCIKMMLSPRKLGRGSSEGTSGMVARLLAIGASAKTAILALALTT